MLVVDWGTTNLRAYFCQDDGLIRARTELARGIKAVPSGQYPEVLHQILAKLDITAEQQVYVCGMAGARGGWLDAPYCETPVTLSALKEKLIPLPEPFHGFLIPGLKTMAVDGALDVIRGEEVQIFGALRLLGLENALICLPGTHSKWVYVKNRQITAFMTFMTGDVFAALKQTILNYRDDDQFSPQAFESGLTESHHTGGGLLHQLFTARTRMLSADLKEEQVASFVSGLLIGHELKEAEMFRDAVDQVVIIGSDRLCHRYRMALEQTSVAIETLGSDIAACSGVAALRQVS